MLGDGFEGGAEMRDCNENNDRHDSSASQPSAAEIQQWMVDYIARELAVPPDQVDVSVPFEHFALDSTTAIGMTGDLESWLGCRIDPTVVYDYPTIQDMAQYLAGESGSGPSG
jgi:acyl carrier protein